MQLKTNGMIFLLAFVLAFAGGYFFFNSGKTEVMQAVTNEQSTKKEVVEEEESQSEEQASAEFEIFNTNSCLSCHAVSSLGLEGGITGPDLSNSYTDIEGKHGVDLDSFLKEPTSAVMTGVIEGNPLSDEDRAEIVDLLKKASEE
ncbi:cytochrome C [Sporosarcina pasteurii]|uniref:Cytochrome c domain-containing protein n=1 Tax=Sporosarcina pasteurii TaxID=1474 RepID=A0A380BC38_SPOPA|nr:cytochrome C [Sporosarcina pasteurii]MDS9472931.1 cytochrome C [Sporosarcina pasteurii]SUI98390.1 Uncharacterised protein [Sporosarcina pasteurii]